MKWSRQLVGPPDEVGDGRGFSASVASKPKPLSWNSCTRSQASPTLWNLAVAPGSELPQQERAGVQSGRMALAVNGWMALAVGRCVQRVLQVCVRAGPGKACARLRSGWCSIACGATVRGTCGTPRLARVQCVAPRGELPCASGTYSTQEAGTPSPYVQHAGSGTHVSAQTSPASGTASAPRRACPGCAAAWCAGRAPAPRRGCRTRRRAASQGAIQLSAARDEAVSAP